MRTLGPVHARGALVVVSLALVMLAWWLPDAARPTIRVLYVASTDALNERNDEEEILEPLIAEFNATETTVGGKVIRVEGRGIASGQAKNMMARQALKPVAWTPASSLWARLLNTDVNAPWIGGGDTILESPQVLAFWEEHADILLDRGTRVGWDDVLRLARNGWTEYGRPDLGDFLLGHTNPEISTSGLSAVLSMYYFASGKNSDLGISEIRNPAVRGKVREIQQSIVHYGETVSDLSDQMRTHGKGFAHAVYMQETSLVEFNSDPPDFGRLIGIYPEEGTFIADYHFFVLSSAVPWVTEEQRRAAEVFGRWLEERIRDPRMAAGYGFRIPGFDAEPPIDEKHGTVGGPPRSQLLPPEGDVITAAQSNWRENRKLANIMLVVDTSASMGREEKLERVRQTLPGCLEELVPEDRIGLITFDDHVRRRASLKERSDGEQELRSALRDLLPGGPKSRLYDATLRAIYSIRLLADLESRIDAVVVLTDGRDVGSATTKEDLLAILAGQDPVEGAIVRVFTVAYGESADKQTLGEIARSSQGLLFEGDQQEIDAICRTVFFSF